jgi:hypothetical protein
VWRITSAIVGCGLVRLGAAGHRLPLLFELWTAIDNERAGGTDSDNLAWTCRLAASGPGSWILFCKQ